MLYARALDLFLEATSSNLRESTLSFLLRVSSLPPQGKALALHGRLFTKELESLGFHIHPWGHSQRSSYDVMMGRRTRRTLSDTLADWKTAVVPGGLVLLCTPRWESSPWAVCGELLRAGFSDPMQEVTRTLIVTSAVVSSAGTKS